MLPSNSKTKYLVFIMAFAILLSAAAIATAEKLQIRSEAAYVQLDPVVSEPAHKMVLAQATSADIAAARESDEPRNISLDFHAADISDVLKALSMQAGTNIVTGNDVKGLVTVSLSKVSFSEAIDMVAKLSGYKYAEVSPSTFVVGSDAALASIAGKGPAVANIVTETMVIRYNDAETLAKAIQDQVPTVKISCGSATKSSAAGGDSKDDSKGKQAVVRGQGIIVISGSEPDVARAKNIITSVEQLSGSGGPDTITDVYRIKYAETASLATVVSSMCPAVSIACGPIDFDCIEKKETKSSGAAAGGGFSSQIIYKTQSTLLVLTGPGPEVRRALSILEKVDIKQPQILIEAKILDLNNDASKDIGVEWSWTEFQSLGQVDIKNVGSNAPPVADGMGIAAAADSIGRTVTRALTLGPTQLKAKLDLMVETGKARLLANPKVAAVSGKPASVFIGDEIKYVISIQNTPTGQNIQTETANPGIQLEALGVVSPDGDITLNLHPEVSVISRYLSLPNGIALPQIARRFTDSTIRIKSGDTIAIGGLIREQEIESMSKVPLLADLPFFGEIFKHRKKSKEHSEITMLITATVLKD